jgi:hypothetical protein
MVDGLVLASRQADAVDKAASYINHIRTHFDKLEEDPESPAANGWRKEIRAAIDNVAKQLKNMKGKTLEEWTKTVNEMRARLNDLTPVN